jgi:ABC-2 type transport system permease protein
MNSPSNAVTQAQATAQPIAATGVSRTAPFLWSIRRELWESKYIYIAPLGVAAVFLLAFAIAYPSHRRLPMTIPYELSGALIMGSALLVGLFYAVDALYSERRDRSILFWKSLPVSDLTAVLSKLAIPLVIVPLLSFVITIVTQFLMLLFSSAVRLGFGLSVAELWSQPAPFFQVSLILLYHIVLVHGLWYMPVYGWLLLVSAWAPRAPLLWAVLPPFVIYGIEKLAFNTSYFLSLLQERFLGPSSHAAAASKNVPLMDELIPHHFFSQPGLWIGIAVGAVFIAAAVRLRRYRGPI